MPISSLRYTLLICGKRDLTPAARSPFVNDGNAVLNCIIGNFMPILKSFKILEKVVYTVVSLQDNTN